MNRDINIKATRINCFRQSKVDGIFMLQMRVPGGMVDAKYLEMIQYMAKTWGDGNFHFGTRQTFDIPGIKYDDIPAVNAYIENYIKEVDAEMCDVDMNKIAGEPAEWDPSSGYPTIGARNITACIGNYHCICGNINTFELARKLEAAGDAGDTEFIEENTAELLEMYRSYSDKFSRLDEESSEEQNEKPPADRDLLDDAFSSLDEFAGQMDYDLVEMVIGSVREYRLEPRDKALFDEADTAFTNLDWSGIRTAAQKYFENNRE